MGKDGIAMLRTRLSNGYAHRDVERTVGNSVNDTLLRAVPVALRGDVYLAVYAPVGWAVFRIMDLVLNLIRPKDGERVTETPPHPGLELYLDGLGQRKNGEMVQAPGPAV